MVTVDSETGFGIITNAMVTDFETNCLHNLSVLAYDEGGRQSVMAATVVIHVTDVNEHTPAFDKNHYYFELTEGTNLSEAITVSDKDLEGVSFKKAIK